jgi:hypothetical protein
MRLCLFSFKKLQEIGKTVYSAICLFWRTCTECLYQTDHPSMQRHHSTIQVYGTVDLVVFNRVLRQQFVVISLDTRLQGRIHKIIE